MEQPVWLFFGVIATLIGLGIIVNVVYINSQDSKHEVAKDNLIKMQTQCNFVCATSEDNRMGIDVQLPSEIKLYTNDNKICALYKDKIYCEACSCVIEPYNLSLDTELAKRFDSTKYTCLFEKLRQGVRMECVG